MVYATEDGPCICDTSIPNMMGTWYIKAEEKEKAMGNVRGNHPEFDKFKESPAVADKCQHKFKRETANGARFQ